MKFFVFVITIFFVFTTFCFSGTKEVDNYEGDCGTRNAQPGPDPVCDPSEETCYVRINYKDGSWGEMEDKIAVYVPSDAVGFIDVDGVNITNLPSGSFSFHIIFNANTSSVPASHLQQFINILESMP